MIEDELEHEILKWLGKIEEKRKMVESVQDKSFIENIDAYISDSKYFHQKGDLIRSFESVIWAWAWLEIGQEIGILTIRECRD